MEYKKEVKIVEKEKIILIGIEGEGSAETSDEWIPALWDLFIKKQREVETLVNYDENNNVIGVWGAMSDAEVPLGRWNERGKYLASFEADLKAVPPAGW